MDFIATKNDDFLVTESNVRRTGGTHVYQTALELIGKDFMIQTFILSSNSYKLPKGLKLTFNELNQKLKSIKFNKQSQEGIVIASANLLTLNTFAYIIFGGNEKRAVEIEKQMEQLLTKP